MQSFLIVSKDKQKQDAYIAAFCNEHHMQTFDIVSLQEEGTIGIEQIRALQKALFLKPLGDEKIIIIHNAETVTVTAQNALLKMLEEPPAHTFILLSVLNKEALLPTILSRCNIIKLDNTKEQKSTTDDSCLLLFDTQTKMSVGQLLLLAQNKGKTKEEALAWLENAVKTAREKLLERETDRSDMIYYIKEIQKTYTIVKTTNVSPRLALEHLLFSL